MKHNINFGHFYIQSNLFLQLVTWYQCVNFVTFVCVRPNCVIFYEEDTKKKKKDKKKLFSYSIIIAQCQNHPNQLVINHQVFV